MFSIIKRILRLSGKYRPRVIAGLIFNALKSCCAAFVFFAVLLVMLNIEHLTETVILQAFGIVALSVLGRFLFQYLSDVLMSASGYEIFREKRLEIGNQLKRAPMGYFTENNLGTVQTVLRFLPSLKQDVLYIKQGMKTRGVGLSFWRIVSHPAQTYEGFLVPILMRLLMTATELSASAETRGISYPCEKTHYILVDFRLRDSILLIGMLALFAVIIWTSFQPISF